MSHLRVGTIQGQVNNQVGDGIIEFMKDLVGLDPVMTATTSTISIFMSVPVANKHLLSGLEEPVFQRQLQSQAAMQEVDLQSTSDYHPASSI